jgi:hypothetical protein
MSCTPISSYNFTGKVTINDGETQQYSGPNMFISPLWSSCAIRQGNQLIIKTTATPIWDVFGRHAKKFTNTVRDVDGRISGTLRFDSTTVTLNGKASFQ